MAEWRKRYQDIEGRGFCAVRILVRINTRVTQRLPLLAIKVERIMDDQSLLYQMCHHQHLVLW